MRQLIDGNAEVVLAQTYKPYGEVLSSAGEGVSSYAYAGEWMDTTGLQYLRARYMNPVVGRFLTRDTWAGDYNSPLSLNRWGYVQGNPVMFTDPSGRANNFPPAPFPPPNPSVPPEYYQMMDDIYRGVTAGKPGVAGVKSDPSKRLYVTTPPPGITWDPVVPINSASQIGSHQYIQDVNGNGRIDEAEEDVSPWGFNFCGQIAVGMVLEAITGGGMSYQEIFDVFKTTDDTSNKDLGRVVENMAHNNGYVIDYLVHANEMQYKVNLDGNLVSSTYVPSNRPYAVDSDAYVRETLAKRHYYITLVNISTSNGLLVESGTGHWIVVTGFSKQWVHSNLFAATNWIRIQNPYKNRTEYYWWPEFRVSVRAAMGLEIWGVN